MKLVNISMVGNLTNALKENADFQRHDTIREAVKNVLAEFVR